MASPATKKGYHAGRQPANRGKKYPPEIVTQDEVSALLRACSNRAPTGVRNQALIAVLYRGGLRIGEALALRTKDLNVDHGTLAILHAKGNKSRTVGMDPVAFGMVLRWLDRRRQLGIAGRSPLFCTLQGKPLKSSYVRGLLPRLASKAGIDRRIHAHALRHSHAHELMWEGIPMPVIQAQLGHTSLATTQRYLDHIAPKDVIDMMQQRQWEP